MPTGNTGTRMTRDWKHWEGSVVSSRFPLHQYLGGSEKSVVFLTERRGQEPQKAAIKLIIVDSSAAELQIARWELAAKLSHPHLLRIFETGRCQLNDATLVYVVMEYAEENLAQIIPQRPLTPEEAREMLEPALDTLAYLHSKSFVHGRLKPANIMAARDQLKLSSDSLVAAGDAILAAKPTAYDAPEIASGRISPASDAWSLGITLMEALTQRLPVCDGIAEPVPEAVPAPFMGIAHCCLRRDPLRRCSAADIAARLRSTPPPPATQRPSTLRIPAESGKWRYILPVLAVALVVAAVLVGPKLLNPHPDAQPGAPVSSAPSNSPVSVEPAPSVVAPKVSAPKVREPEVTKPTPSAAQPKPSPAQAKGSLARLGKEEKKPSVAPPAPLPADSEDAESRVQTADPGKIVQQIVPSIPKSARETITGTVRVSVKVELDRSGKVANATFVSDGPSQYFARKAMQAAQQWQFASDAPRTWILRFGFKRTGTTVVPEPSPR
jgi:TonB family protein